MDLDTGGQARKFIFELVPPRDLERHERDLPRPGGRL
jgi:hypothetical protein